MAAPYQSILQVPDFVPRDQEQDYNNWLQMMKQTEGSRAELAGQKMDTLAGLLSRIPGFTDMHTSATNLISSALKGELTDTHKQVLEQQAAAQRINQGVVGGAGAGVNMSLASFGRAGLAAQQNALAQIPQFMSFSQNAFMGNIANDPAVTGPSWGNWSSQLQADTRDVYESKLAQAKALHQVQQMNEQYAVQKAAADAAHSRMMSLQQAQFNQQMAMRPKPRNSFTITPMAPGTGMSDRPSRLRMRDTTPRVFYSGGGGYSYSGRSTGGRTTSGPVPSYPSSPTPTPTTEYWDSSGWATATSPTAERFRAMRAESPWAFAAPGTLTPEEAGIQWQSPIGQPVGPARSRYLPNIDDPGMGGMNFNNLY